MNENKQVRVDNWGIFFLQRLQLFFSKTDYCDLTLQFHGNVQLKVHRLVLNACTEYFEALERSDRLIDDNVVLMPEMLQADVVVPIINFMYTGMLEYPIDLYQKLYQASELMRISVLTKLLDAQKQTMIIPTTLNKTEKKTKIKQPKLNNEQNSLNSSIISQSKRIPTKSSLSESVSTIPGRKLPVWKRKAIPYTSNKFEYSPESKRRSDCSYENAAKPTRFEWPEDDTDLPPVDMMDDISYFGDISYTSRPLLREDEVKPIFHSPSEMSRAPKVKEESHEINIENINQQVPGRGTSEKRKLSEDSLIDKSPKKIKIVESENETTISVFFSNSSVNFDPTKIVSEILKKYPHLVKKKKNIKLKILSKPIEQDSPETKVRKGKGEDKKVVPKIETQDSRYDITSVKENIWSCKECCDNNGKPLEFVLYYLYRKHMTDVHYMKFDPRICKYCGKAFAVNDLHAFHLFTKHGIKPSGNLVFPSCSQCPYVALSKQALQIHRTKHKKSERQCTDCKLAFNSYESRSHHIQITGHMGKIKRNIYDCQYCMKTSQSAISLLSHIKSNHEADGRRDGIVSLDEVDLEEEVELEEHIEEGAAEGEYILPEIRSPHPKKVKIISDVKVPPTKNVNRAEVVALDPNNSTTVPTSIATSLGLLDIVVLDENQQLILQNPEEQTGQSRTEYILPQITPRAVSDDTLGATSDELVMVLTDQDYKEGHTAIAADNSNIVVLYSHPADGQQGQFITSQGNLMVNSETGLLEIRNGATIATTSANQIVVRDSHENHIETIEMIQREINGSRVMKEEPIFEEDRKPQIAHEEVDSENYVQLPNVTDDHNVETEVVSSISHSEEPEVIKVSATENDMGMVEEVHSTQLNVMNESTHTSDVFSVEDTGNQGTLRESTDCSVEHSELVDQEESIGRNQDAESGLSDVPSTREENLCEANHMMQSSNEPEHILQEQDINIVQTGEVSVETEASAEDNTHALQENITESEAVDIDKNVHSDAISEKETQAPASPTKPTEVEDAEKPYSPTDNPIDIECDIESYPDPNEKQDTESVNENEVPQCDLEPVEQVRTELAQCHVEPVSHENDECSQSSQESSQVLNMDDTQEACVSPKDSTKISILDDWEDTDSQQSDNRTKLAKKGAQETVHKLMDDWEEDDVEK